MKDVEKVDSLLAEAKGKFKAMVLVGVSEKGTMEILSEPANVAVNHWILNRALFELNLLEKGAYASEQ
jgi:hypothetical protein